MWEKVLGFCLCLLVINIAHASKVKRPANYGNCLREEYLCANQKCIHKTQFCNGVNDCGDNTDEIFCRLPNNKARKPTHVPHFYCNTKYPSRVIPSVWVCDGQVDCHGNNRDEPATCATHGIVMYDDVERVPGAIDARNKAVNWILEHRHGFPGTDKWGLNAPRIAMALYLSDPKYFDGENTIGNELTYEIENQVLVSMLRAKTDKLTMNELAWYIHALLITCSGPWDFHGVNLVEKLRTQVDNEPSYVSPFAILALCSAKDTMTTTDIKKLIETFEIKGRSSWKSSQALVLMTLSCIAKLDNGPKVDPSVISRLSDELKKDQFNNGSFENLYTTGMVMQALFASETEDSGNWNMNQAVSYIVNSQVADGSFGNHLNTYFVLPALFYNDPTNISNSHCPKNVSSEGVDALEELSHKIGERVFMKYTLWFGDKVDLAYSLEVRIVENMTLFDVMNVAKRLDSKYDFSYNLIDLKPYIYRLAGYQEDPEHEKYWFLYRTHGTGFATIPLNSSPVDIIPKDHEEYIMWYRSGHWIQNQPAMEIVLSE